MNEKYNFKMHVAKERALKTISSSLYRQQVGVFVNKLPTETN